MLATGARSVTICLPIECQQQQSLFPLVLKYILFQIFYINRVRVLATSNNQRVKKGHTVRSTVVLMQVLGWYTPQGGGTPLYGLYRYVQPQGVWFFSHFGHKLGIDFSHFATILVINRVSIFVLQSSFRFFQKKLLLLPSTFILPSALCHPLLHLTPTTQAR